MVDHVDHGYLCVVLSAEYPDRAALRAETVFKIEMEPGYGPSHPGIRSYVYSSYATGLDAYIWRCGVCPN